MLQPRKDASAQSHNRILRLEIDVRGAEVEDRLWNLQIISAQINLGHMICVMTCIMTKIEYDKFYKFLV